MAGPAPVIYFDLGDTLIYYDASGIAHPYSDATSTLETLNGRGYRIGLLSNQSAGTTVADVRDRLIGLGLSDFIDTITISSEITNNLGKPHAPIFNLALQKAGHANASNQTVFITETIGHVEAARNLGWRSILKRNSGTCAASDGECVVGLAPLTLLFPALASDLWIRDAPGHSGTEYFSGTGWWNSPDLWIRNQDDGGTTHQHPVAGQDNWFYARVRNRGNSIVRSYAVGFRIKPWLGTQFVYPQDWMPPISIAMGGVLEPDQVQVVKAGWPASEVPAAGTHACWLAAVFTSNDPTTFGSSAWEHNNLAQKNLTIVDADPGDSVAVPIYIGSRLSAQRQFHRIEIVRPSRWSGLQVSLKHPHPEPIKTLIREGQKYQSSFLQLGRDPELRFLKPSSVEFVSSGAGIKFLVQEGSSLKMRSEKSARRPGLELPNDAVNFLGESLNLSSGRIVGFPIAIPARTEIRLPVNLNIPASAKPGERIRVDVVQRNQRGELVGGVTIYIRLRQAIGG